METVYDIREFAAPEPKPRKMGICPVCGIKDDLTEYEGEVMCQSCLEGMAEGE